MRLTTIVVAMLSVPAVAVIAGEHRSSPNEIFGPIAGRLQSEVATLNVANRGEEEPYVSSDVNRILNTARTNTLSKIPMDDHPLRRYVEDRLPGSVEDPDLTGFVSRGRAETALDAAMRLLKSLTQMPSLLLDLKIRSAPAQAVFELTPKVGTPLQATSDDRITNLYRGEYLYRVRKAGYKEISQTIDFIERSGNTLECQLIPSSQGQAAVPCKLK